MDFCILYLMTCYFALLSSLAYWFYSETVNIFLNVCHCPRGAEKKSIRWTVPKNEEYILGNLLHCHQLLN